MGDVLTLETGRRELARRSDDGVEVALFWHVRDDSLSVEVCDRKTGDSFRLDAPRDRGLDVFYHPYAYAARRELDYADALAPAA